MDHGTREIVRRLSTGARLTVILLGWATSLGAQPPLPAPPASAEITSPADQPFVFQERVTRVRYEADGRGTQETSLLIRIQSDQAVRHWGQLAFVYTPASQDLTVPVLEIRKPDGSVVKPNESAVLDAAVQPGAAAAMFTDIRQKHITLPSLAVGDVVALRLIWAIHTPIASRHFWYQHDFERAAIVLDDRLELDLPASAVPTIRLAADAPASADGADGRIEDGRRRWHWKTSNLNVSQPAADGPEDEDDEPPVADVRISTFKDWSEVGRWYHALAAPAAAPDATVRARAVELTRGLTSETEKIQALYDFVSNRIRYVSLSFGLGRYAPHDAAEVLKNQYGDCKDKHTLLAALLGAIGVEAWPVLANSTRKIDRDLPSPSEFDHLITVIPLGEDPAGWVWLDTTSGAAPYGMLFANLRDRDVLVVRPDSTRAASLARTPSSPPFEMSATLEIEGAVNVLGVLNGLVRYSMRSDEEILLRSLLQSATREQRNEFVKSFAQQLRLGTDVREPRIVNLETAREPLAIEFRLRQRGRFKWTTERTTLDLALPPFHVPSEDEAKSGKASRLRFGGRHTITYRATLDLPPGYAPEVPVGITLERDGYSFASTYTSEDGRVAVQRVLRTQVHEIDGSRAGEYLAFVAGIRADHEQAVELDFAFTSVPEIPEDATAAEVYAAGHAAFERSQYEAALAFFMKAVELDPKHDSGWNAVGLAYERLEDLEQAVAAHRKQTEVSPFSKRAFRDLGRVLTEQRKTTEARVAYERHLELNPLDGEALNALGGLLVDAGEYATAVPHLERAAGLLKTDAWVAARLGAAYAGRKAPAEARRAFQRAMDLSATPAIWTYAAWQLARSGVELDFAEDLGGRTLARAQKAFGALSLANLDASLIDLVERVTWTWDALGLVHFHRGDLAAAERYVEAAWWLAAQASTADHLGQILEKQERMTEATSSYLSALGVASGDRPDTERRVRRIVGENADIEALVKAVPRSASLERYVPMPHLELPKGSAEFTVLLRHDGTVADVRFETGDDGFESAAEALLKTVYSARFPDDTVPLMPFRARVDCSPDTDGCRTAIIPPRFVRTPKP